MVFDGRKPESEDGRGSKPERWILHADMDAFFASVEQRDRPELVGKPVIVGGTSSRGVVSAASYEARRFGVRSAMPTFKAKQLCPEGVFLPGDMRKYAEASRAIHEVFEEFTSQIEPLALDEAFLDISGSLKLLGPPEQIARNLKRRVWERTKLRVSVGVAPNKLVAKIACGLGKPDGLKIVRPEEVPEVLGPLDIRKLWGIGPKTENRLRRLGINSFDDLARASPRVLSQAFGRFAEEMRGRARGFDDRPVETSRAPKSIGEEATFPENVSDLERLSDALVVHAAAVAARARRAGYVGSVVQVKLKLAQKKRGEVLHAHDLFEARSRQKTLSEPTSDDRTLFLAARKLLEQMHQGAPVRLIGLGLAGLRRASEQQATPRIAPPVQLELALSVALPKTEGSDDRREAELTQVLRRPPLGQVLDQINDKFGKGTLRRAVEGVEKLSPHDKTKVGET